MTPRLLVVNQIALPPPAVSPELVPTRGVGMPRLISLQVQIVLENQVVTFPVQPTRFFSWNRMLVIRRALRDFRDRVGVATPVVTRPGPVGMLVWMEVRFSL